MYRYAPRRLTTALPRVALWLALICGAILPPSTVVAQEIQQEGQAAAGGDRRESPTAPLPEARIPETRTTPPVHAGTDSGQKLHAPAEQEEFSVVIFGDRTGGPRSGLKVLESAIRMTNHIDPTFVLTVGDLIQGYNRETAWLLEAAEFKGLMNHLNAPWYPVAGNHDVYARPDKAGGHMDLYKKHFGPLYYSFDYKWAHFIVLFSDEALGFHNPSRTQNMSAEQMEWLGNDLATTRASQVFVFMHHPRWNYEGCNWPEVHEILAQDGRVEAVVAGHIHTYRDDGVRDGIHYYAMATTGGHRGELRETASIHHVNHLRIRRTRWSMAVLPVGSVLGGDFALGSEVDAMRQLQDNGIEVTGTVFVHAEQGLESPLTLRFKNPTDRRLPYKITLALPDGWLLSKELPHTHGEVEPGQSLDFPLAIRTTPAPGPDKQKPKAQRSRAPRPRLQVTLHYPLRHRAGQKVLTEEIELSTAIPVRLTGLSAQAGPRKKNKVLRLDGKSAIRVPLSNSLADVDHFTVECWVRGSTPLSRAGLITKTESSSFGIFWSEREEPLGPSGYAHIAGHGYIEAQPKEGWRWEQWTHVALCYDGEWLRFFVNGAVAAATQHRGKVTRNKHPLYIGADPNSRGRANSFFTGVIDEVRVSKTARYSDSFEPQRIFDTDADTLLLLHFDGIANGVHPDASAHENHGWKVGKPRLEFDPRP